MAVRGKSVRLLPGVHLPNAIRAVGMAPRSIQQAGPEHESLNFLTAGLLNSLVAHLADKHWHFRAGFERMTNTVNRIRDALAVSVASLQHIEVHHRRVIHAIARATGRMDRNRAPQRIHSSHISGYLRPAVFLCFRILGLSLRQIERHRPLSGQTPDGRIRAPARDEVAPVLLHFFESHEGQEVAPTAYDAGDNAMIGKIFYANVSHIEIGRIDAGVIALPRKAGFIGATSVVRRHVRIEARDYLNHRKAFLETIRN